MRRNSLIAAVILLPLITSGLSGPAAAQIYDCGIKYGFCLAKCPADDSWCRRGCGIAKVICDRGPLPELKMVDPPVRPNSDTGIAVPRPSILDNGGTGIPPAGGGPAPMGTPGGVPKAPASGPSLR